MATFTGSRAGANFPGPYAPINGGTPWAGTCAVTANPTAAQTFGLFWVPAGFVCVGGMFYSSDLDTNASETLEWNLGWAANGGSGTYDAVDTDGLGDFGMMNGDAFANPSISPASRRASTSRRGLSGGARSRCLWAFSIITMAASTIAPMAMAMPPRLMMLEDSPSTCIQM